MERIPCADKGSSSAAMNRADAERREMHCRTGGVYHISADDSTNTTRRGLARKGRGIAGSRFIRIFP